MGGKVILVLILFVLSAGSALADPPTEEWVSLYTGGSTQEGKDIAVDAAGNVYVLGDCRIGFVTYMLTIKYDSEGQEQWATLSIGPSESHTIGYGIAVDSEGNVYVTGTTYITGQLDDYCTVKYDSGGVEQWMATYNGTSNRQDWSNAIGVDADGNVYVTGFSYNSGTYWDITTIKYDSEGVQQWVEVFDGPHGYADQAWAMNVEEDGTVYVTGSSYLSSKSYSAYATIKYDSDGQEQWVAFYEGPRHYLSRAWAITCDDAGNVFVTGGSVGFTGSDEYDVATVMYDEYGNEEWSARYDGPVCGDDEAVSIAVDGSGNVFVAGYSAGDDTADDYVTIKYDIEGNQEWVARYDGPASFNDEAMSLALDGNGNAYVTGYSSGIVTGDDCLTIKYDTEGVEEWVLRYDGYATNNRCRASAISVFGEDEFCVTGYTGVYVTDYNCITIKYSQESGLPVEEPLAVSLYPVYPNPGRLSSNIGYYIPEPMEVEIGVFDLSGRLVFHDSREDAPGSHLVSCTDLPSGSYVCRLTTPSGSLSRLFTVIR